MRTFLTKLLSASIEVVFLSIACLFMSPIAVVSAHPASHQVQLVSGGGCSTSSDGLVGACLGINGQADIYLNKGVCADFYDIQLKDLTAGTRLDASNEAGCLVGHYLGPKMTIVAGHTYVTTAYVEYNGTTHITQDSPEVFG
jgi:hypothetical protein